MAKTHPHDAALLELRAFGLSYPGTHPKSPWPDHYDLAVNDKTFAYLSLEGDPLAMSCKLPESGEEALMLPGTSPTEYGLGKWGWVSIRFDRADPVPVEMLKAWLDESYRSQAPARLVRTLSPAAGATATKKTATKKTATKKTATKKTATKKTATKKTGR